MNGVQEAGGSNPLTQIHKYHDYYRRIMIFFCHAEIEKIGKTGEKVIYC
jgi:hypothetical protein